MAVCQNLVPLVNIKIAGKWMFIPLKMVLIGIDPYPYGLVLQIIMNQPLGEAMKSCGDRSKAALALSCSDRTATPWLQSQHQGKLPSPGVQNSPLYMVSLE